MLITAQNIEKSYGTLKVLKGVSLQINSGEIVSITGASGAGKTTLLHILGTLEYTDSGTLMYEKTLVQKLSEKERSAFRNQHIGFVFQFHHLLPEFTALENICLPALIGGKSLKYAKERALDLLRFMKLEDRATHKPSELSGGEQQRIAVARALMNQPAVILADEPSGNLDSANAKELHALFFQLRESFGQTFVIVTHNPELAQMADRQLIMKDGTLQM